MVLTHSSQDEKNKVKARHLNNTINKVHAMFKEENPAIKIARSKFAELRPKHVLPSSNYHENLILEFPVYDHKLQ